MWKDTHHGELLSYPLESKGEGNLRTWTVVFEYPKFFIRHDGQTTKRVEK